MKYVNTFSKLQILAQTISARYRDSVTTRVVEVPHSTSDPFLDQGFTGDPVYIL